MRILVISDTHIPVTAEKLPAIIEEEARKSDYCLHCGDFIAYSVFETLSSLTKTYGVCGNMDDDCVQERLPQKRIIKLPGLSIGLTHGSGHPDNIINCINKTFAEEFSAVDIFVFGHSHKPLNKKINGKIYFNPGSVLDKVFAEYRSYGILEVEDGSLKRRLVKIE